MTNINSSSSVHSQCRLCAEYLILISAPSKFAQLVGLFHSCPLIFLKRILVAVCISSPEFSSVSSSAAATRDNSTSLSDMCAVKFKTGSGRAAPQVQARVSQSHIEKGGLPLGSRPKRKIAPQTRGCETIQYQSRLRQKA